MQHIFMCLLTNLSLNKQKLFDQMQRHVFRLYLLCWQKSKYLILRYANTLRKGNLLIRKSSCLPLLSVISFITCSFSLES